MTEPSLTKSSALIPGWLVLLGALMALGPLSIDMYLPALPTIAQSVQAPEGNIGLTLAAFFIGMSFGQLIYGPVSDRFGRKKPLYAGLIIYVLASLGCAAAGSLQELIVLRFLQALGGCSGSVITRAVVRDRCTARDMARAFSMLTLVMGIAPIVAPVIGGALLLWMGWRWLFVLLSAYGAICLVVTILRLPESHDTRHAQPLALGAALGGYVNLLGSRLYLGAVLCGGFGMAGLFAYITGSPFVFIELHHFSPQQFSFLFGATAMTFIGASQINAWLLRRFELMQLLRVAVWLSPCAGVLLLIAVHLAPHNWWIFWLGLLAFVSSLGFIAPNSSAAAMATHGQQAGMASALLGSMQFLLATAAGSLVGIWHDGSSVPLAAIMFACGVCVWLSYYGLVRPHVRQHAPPH